MLFELFLRNNSLNSRERQVFWLFCVTEVQLEDNLTSESSSTLFSYLTFHNLQSTFAHVLSELQNYLS